jgi:hypothetical protein
MILGGPELVGHLQLRTLCGNQDMRCRRDISVVVGLRRAIEIKLQAVLLHAIDVIESDGDRFARKGLNALGNGARGLSGIDNRRARRMTTDTLMTTANAVSRVKRLSPARDSSATVMASAKTAATAAATQVPGSPEQVMVHRYGRGGESGKE